MSAFPLPGIFSSPTCPESARPLGTDCLLQTDITGQSRVPGRQGSEEVVAFSSGSGGSRLQVLSKCGLADGWAPQALHTSWELPELLRLGEVGGGVGRLCGA